MITKRRFATYKLVTKSLAANGFTKSGSLATLLLETFVCNFGELRAALVVERGLCKDGDFVKWRDELIQKGWLNYTVGNYSRHSPGAKLVKYINKEKMAKEEIATTREVQRVDEKVDKLQQEVSQLKKVVTQMIEEFDPPVTDEKLQKRLKLVK